MLCIFDNSCNQDISSTLDFEFHPWIYTRTKTPNANDFVVCTLADSYNSLGNRGIQSILQRFKLTNFPFFTYLSFHNLFTHLIPFSFIYSTPFPSLSFIFLTPQFPSSLLSLHIPPFPFFCLLGFSRVYLVGIFI